jgi:hypothetical protein
MLRGISGCRVILFFDRSHSKQMQIPKGSSVPLFIDFDSISRNTNLTHFELKALLAAPTTWDGEASAKLSLFLALVEDGQFLVLPKTSCFSIPNAENIMALAEHRPYSHSGRNAPP